MTDNEYNVLLKMPPELVEAFGATEALRWEMRRRCWSWLFAFLDGAYFAGAVLNARWVR